jgi:aspartyl-tRNA(Asn)/glutamyl-tRNA(Gln) amidotransferase subunit A
MPDTPWTGDACSLVDAFRAGEISPQEELDATLAAIEASQLNCFSYVDPERAQRACADANVNLPFGGLPTGIKELFPFEGWPNTEGSLVFKDRIADHTSRHLERLVEKGGIVPVGLTTSSEFGGLNVSVTKLNGVTHNPWKHGHTAGGSSGGSASAVAGGLLTLGTGGDGGGSLRIPAGYNGLFTLKGTFGRVTRAPHAFSRPNTVVFGNLARSVRDVARYLDVCAGVDPWDPTSLPSDRRWEAQLGTVDLRGMKAAVIPAIGGALLDPGMREHVEAQADQLIAWAGLKRVEVEVVIPTLSAQWMMGNLATLLADLGSLWPRCLPDLTDEIGIGLLLAQSLYNLHLAAVSKELRIMANEAMGRAFERCDMIIAAVNPGVAFPAHAPTSSQEKSFVDVATTNPATRMAFKGLMAGVRVAASAAPRLPAALISAVSERFPDMLAMGALTMISNLYGNPAVSIPSGTIDGLPVGLQVLGRHHEDAVLLDIGLCMERNQPWPLVAPERRPTRLQIQPVTGSLARSQDHRK